MQATRAANALICTLAATLLAAGDLAFVTNQNSNDLSVLDLDTRNEIARIDVPGKPAGVAVLDGAVYTVSPDDKTVRKFDQTTGAPLAALTLDGGPIGIAVDPVSMRLFVSDWYNARIWVIGTDMTLHDTLTTGAAPAGLVVAKDGTWLASADRDADQVSIFDLDTLGLRHTVAVGTRPFGVSVGPGGRIFAGNVGSKNLSVIDPLAGAVVGEVAVGDRPYGVAFAKDLGFATNQYSDTLSVFEVDSLKTVATIDVGEYPEGIDVTSDGQTVVVANWFSNTVSLIDTATLNVVGTIDTGDGPRAFGRFIAPRTGE